MKLSRFAVTHPVVIGMIIIVFAAFGILSLSTMNVAFMSDISIPSVMVISIYPGAGAEDVEEEITNILEADFVTLPGFKNISSSSANSVSAITISFQDDIDPYDQLTEVRNRINQKMPDLPEGIQGIPNVLVGGVDMLPIITFTLTGGEDSARLTDYIENTIKPQITSISGVSDVKITGNKTLQLNIKLRMADLMSKGISVTEVYQTLNYANIKLPIGTAEYENRVIDVRYDGSFSSITDIENLPVGIGDGDVIIRLKDIADIGLDYPDSDILVTDGQANIIVASVTKRSDGNVMDITKEVKEVLAKSTSDTNGAVHYEVVSDDSRIVNASISTVIRSGVTGIIMAIIVFLLFLSDARATLIIGISIPLSLLFTFIGMKVMGLGLNLMTLSGMVVALGMVVDGSIVMIEQVYRHYHKRNSDGTRALSVSNAIYAGSDEVASSIFAGAATTIVVFIPIALLSGLVGMILKDVAITLILTITASLLVAIIVVPFLLKQFLRPEGPKEKPPTKFNRGVAKLERVYKKMLSWSLINRKFVLVLAITLLILAGFLIQSLGIAFIPSTDNSDFYATIKFPVGQSLEKTQEELIGAKNLIDAQVSEVHTAVVYSGTTDDLVSAGSNSNKGYIHVVLVPVAERTRRVQEIILEVQNLLSSSIPDASITVSNGGFDRLLGLVTGGTGYGITLVSENLDVLYSEALRIQNFLRTDPDVVTVDMNTSFDNTTFVIDMSHEYMSSLGITSYESGITSAILFSGMDIGRFSDKTDNTRYDIRLFSDITDRPITKDTLSNIRVKSMSGEIVSFAVLANTITEQSMSTINHTDRAKTITISTTLVGEDTSGVNNRMQNFLAQNPLAYGVQNQTGGILELIEDSVPPMITALLSACFLVYTIMVLQFEKFRQPFLVMGTVPFSIIGVVISLLIFGSTLSLLSFFGIISLVGIVVNNGIILIDYIELLRKKTTQSSHETKKTLAENIVVGSASRIRPIFMTSLTTMLGVVPMAMSTGEGSEIYASLGQAIAGGLLTSTLITLFIIPVLYYMSESRHLMKANSLHSKSQTAQRKSANTTKKEGL